MPPRDKRVARDMRGARRRVERRVLERQRAMQQRVRDNIV